MSTATLAAYFFGALALWPVFLIFVFWIVKLGERARLRKFSHHGS